MIQAQSIADTFIASMEGSRCVTEPHRHFLLSNCLPPDVAEAAATLPVAPPKVSSTEGKRATNNDTRFHFNPENRAKFDVMDAIALGFQEPEVASTIERVTGIDLSDSLLRVEYCQDIDGFWLEPHVDISVKRLSLMIYLTKDDDTLGTDLYMDEQTHAGAPPAPFNSGLMFVTGDETLHGFERRPIKSVRKSLMVNYVGSDWRSTQELAFPDQAVK